jgi:hypothetical protein
MSIDYLFELERNIEGGKEVFACPGVGRNQWVIAKSADELRKHAKRAAENRKIAVDIVRLIPRTDAVAGDTFLAPTNIGEVGGRGEPQIQWAVFDTKEAAETMRDMRKGPSPVFGMQVMETITPENSPSLK